MTNSAAFIPIRPKRLSSFSPKCQTLTCLTVVLRKHRIF